VRNQANALVTNQQVGVKISVIQGTTTGALVYSETHAPTTNANGLFSIEIGGGVVLADSFSKIDWVNGPFFLKTEIDPTGGANYTITGISQLLSVPYAMHARTADSIVGLKSFSGNYNDLINKPITISSIAGDTFYLSNGLYILSAKSVKPLNLPTLVTNTVTNIGSNSCKLTGNVLSNDSSSKIIERGFVISTNTNPNLVNTLKKLYSLNDTGSLLALINYSYDASFNISPNTTYYIRSYAITESNMSLYGNEVSFTSNSVGQQGPTGGIIFYDKGDTTGGWRYLEAAPTDQSLGIVWGCPDSNSLITNGEIGAGKANTLMIVSSCNDTNFAAKLCNDLVLGAQSDWFLPSANELSLLLKSVSNIPSNGEGYWSSTTMGNNPNSFGRTNSYIIYGTMFKQAEQRVRAIRAF